MVKFLVKGRYRQTRKLLKRNEFDQISFLKSEQRPTIYDYDTTKNLNVVLFGLFKSVEVGCRGTCADQDVWCKNARRKSPF